MRIMSIATKGCFRSIAMKFSLLNSSTVVRPSATTRCRAYVFWNRANSLTKAPRRVVRTFWFASPGRTT